jgi:hypothetical protein
MPQGEVYGVHSQRYSRCTTYTRQDQECAATHQGIEIRGEAEVLDTGGTELGRGFAPEMFRITPQRIVSWELGDQMSFNGRSVP